MGLALTGSALATIAGAALAITVGWASILLARRVPFERALGPQGVRALAAASLLVAGFMVLGVPAPAWAGWAVIAGAAGVAVVVRARRRGGAGVA